MTHAKTYSSWMLKFPPASQRVFLPTVPHRYTLILLILSKSIPASATLGINHPHTSTQKWWFRSTKAEIHGGNVACLRTSHQVCVDGFWDTKTFTKKTPTLSLILIIISGVCFGRWRLQKWVNGCHKTETHPGLCQFGNPAKHVPSL